MHIEIPDGVLPVWLWVGGFIIAGLLLLAAIYFARKKERKMPLAALFSALSLLVMSIPLGLPVHINLMVLIGILLGPSWSLIVAFVVNAFLATLGHGGVTVIGLNTLLLWLQAAFGYYLFYFVRNTVKGKSYVFKGAMGSVVAFLSLFASFVFLVGMVYGINLSPEEVLVHDHSHEHPHEHVEETNNHHDHSHEAEMEKYYEDEIDIEPFLALALPLFLYAALIESAVTGVALSFISRSNPDLL